MNKFVYLAGPILGCTEGEAKSWREYVDDRLQLNYQDGTSQRIVGISPLRCEPIHGERYGVGYEDPKFGTARAIAAKNLADVRMCDMTLAYFPKMPEGRHPSLGTIVEIAWAHAEGKPVIVVSDDPIILTHPVVNSCAGWMLPTLDDAIEVVNGILGGYVGGKNI